MDKKEQTKISRNDNVRNSNDLLQNERSKVQKSEEMIEVRCPNLVVDRNNKIWTCNALLLKMTKDSAVNIRCRKCKALLTIVVGKKDGKIKAKIQ